MKGNYKNELVRFTIIMDRGLRELVDKKVKPFYARKLDEHEITAGNAVNALIKEWLEKHEALSK